MASVFAEPCIGTKDTACVDACPVDCIHPKFEQEALCIIQNGLDRGVSARLIRRAARMLQSYELMYWDTLASASAVLPDRGE